MIALYHRTRADIARSILATGFQDGDGYYMTNNHHGGVWFSDSPLGPEEGAYGDTMLFIRVHENEIVRFEWTDQEKPYREWLIPAHVVNQLGPIAIIE
jgi:hypothetical protein